MKVLYLLSVLLFPLVAFGQYDVCEFVRGDANCDLNVDITDVYNIANGQFSNADAADANDDGAVNITDSIYLSHHLFLGTAPPPCPYPDPGLDCTPDNLENCCSPPLNRQFGLPNSIATQSTGGDAWDSDVTSAHGYGGNKQFSRHTIFNGGVCYHQETSEWCGAVWSYGDTTGFTKNRLVGGVQRVILKILLDTTYTRGAVCSESGCGGNNTLQLDVDDPTAFIWFGKPGVDNDMSIAVDLSMNGGEFTYYRMQGPNGCVISGLSSKTTSEQLEIDITDKLIEAVEDGEPCDLLVIKNNLLFPMFVNYNRNGSADIATTEQVVLDSKAEITYAWCICQ